MDISYVEFTTYVPTAIGSLSALVSLRMRSCYDTPPSLSSLTNLTRLTFLDMSGNRATGQLTDLSTVSNLQYCDLSYNSITGTIPDPMPQLQSVR